MASSYCVELLTGLYQSLFLDFLSTLCMCTQNDQRIKHLKGLFMYIHKCAIYIKDINLSLNLSISFHGFYRTESNCLPLLLSESN